MYTLDASVLISALNPAEAESDPSQTFLTQVRQRSLPLFCPTLLLVEVVAAVARILGDVERALKLATAVRNWPNQTLISLDDALADRAANLAAIARLRGADAIYAAVAQQYDTTLVTLDRRQLERLPSLINAARPDDVLRDLAG